MQTAMTIVGWTNGLVSWGGRVQRGKGGGGGELVALPTNACVEGRQGLHIGLSHMSTCPHKQPLPPPYFPCIHIPRCGQSGHLFKGKLGVEGVLFANGCRRPRLICISDVQFVPKHNGTHGSCNIHRCTTSDSHADVAHWALHHSSGLSMVDAISDSFGELPIKAAGSSRRERLQRHMLERSKPKYSPGNIREAHSAQSSVQLPLLVCNRHFIDFGPVVPHTVSNSPPIISLAC